MWNKFQWICETFHLTYQLTSPLLVNPKGSWWMTGHVSFSQCLDGVHVLEFLEDLNTWTRGPSYALYIARPSQLPLMTPYNGVICRMLADSSFFSALIVSLCFPQHFNPRPPARGKGLFTAWRKKRHDGFKRREPAPGLMAGFLPRGR